MSQTPAINIRNRLENPYNMISLDRFLPSAQASRELAQMLYTEARELPLVCPHGHVDPRLFADENYSFGTPTELFITPDHYIFRMLYSQGIPLENLGIKRVDGEAVERDHRRVWQIFADNFHLFRATPTTRTVKPTVAGTL